MQKAWKIVRTVIFTVLIIGIICAAVGLITGADMYRIKTIIFERFQLDYVISIYRQKIESILQMIAEGV